MDRLKTMGDVQLHEELRRLERDVEGFRMRAAAVAATVEDSGRAVLSDPLYQRLTSIHEFLADRLAEVEREIDRRTAEAAAPRTWSLRAILRPSAFAGSS